MNRDNSYLIGNQFAVGSKPNKSSFKKGMKPWNYGLKGWKPKGSEKTQFKKGQSGRNWLPVGSIRKRKDKAGTVRNFIKISEPNIWKIYAVKLWEDKFGLVPKGYVVHHINRNPLDDRIENLSLLTRVAHLMEHRNDMQSSKNGKRSG